MVYLDNNATTPLDPSVADKMSRFLREHFGNPSSLYPIGRQVKEMLNEARDHVGRALGADKAEIIFTGSGTEADNHAILGVMDALRTGPSSSPRRSSIRPFKRPPLYWRSGASRSPTSRSTATGLLDLDALQDAVTPRTALVSVMHANNEIGTIQPIAEIARIAHDKGALVHTDAVQSFGKIAVTVERAGRRTF